MLRTRGGKIKEQNKDLLEKVSESLKDIVDYLMIERKIPPEETIGLIAGSATILVGAVGIRQRLKGDKKEETKVEEK